MFREPIWVIYKLWNNKRMDSQHTIEFLFGVFTYQLDPISLPSKALRQINVRESTHALTWNTLNLVQSIFRFHARHSYTLQESKLIQILIWCLFFELFNLFLIWFPAVVKSTLHHSHFSRQWSMPHWTTWEIFRKVRACFPYKQIGRSSHLNTHCSLLYKLIWNLFFIWM